MALHLILGGTASGKSAYAEKRARNAWEKREKEGGRLFYLATMDASEDQESQERIARHRAMRAGKGFSTIECPVGLENVFCRKEDVVLLEDLSNLLANALYLPDGALYTLRERNAAWLHDAPCPTTSLPGTLRDALEHSLLMPLLSLSESVGECFLVGNLLFSDGVIYAPETEAYLRMLSFLHECLSSSARSVTELVCGIPLKIR